MDVKFERKKKKTRTSQVFCNTTLTFVNYLPLILPLFCVFKKNKLKLYRGIKEEKSYLFKNFIYKILAYNFVLLFSSWRKVACFKNQV